MSNKDFKTLQREKRETMKPAAMQMAKKFTHKTTDGWCCACDADQAFMEGRINKAVANALWDLHEYMGQFPDDLNLAAMSEWIKGVEEELRNE